MLISLLRTLVTMLLLVVPFYLVSTLQLGRATQDQERVIEKRSNSVINNEPVLIAAVKTKKGVVEIGKIFRDDNDWVKGLTVKVKNTSPKNITYVSILLSFERPEDHESVSEPPLVDWLTYGSKAYTPGSTTKAEQTKPLASGDSVDISLPDETFDAHKRALNKLKYPASLKKIRIYVAEVIFDDGTSWSSGYWFRRDPSNPEGWIPVEQPGSVENPLIQFHGAVR